MKNLKVLLHREKVAFSSITYVFTGDDYLLRLNKQYLDHDTYTDILTFPLSESDAPLEAEIYISIERVAENAERFDQPFTTELYRVMIHGLLHLCGYDDHSPEEIREIRGKEQEYLQLFECST